MCFNTLRFLSALRFGLEQMALGHGLLMACDAFYVTALKVSVITRPQ